MDQRRRHAPADLRAVFWLWMLVIGCGLVTMITLPLVGR